MSRPLILLVDDDATVRAAVSAALAGEGYDVDWFGDPEAHSIGTAGLCLV